MNRGEAVELASIEIDISSASYLLFIFKALEAYWKVSSRAGRRLSQRLSRACWRQFLKGKGRARQSPKKEIEYPEFAEKPLPLK